jgi:hypothetical protein
MCHKRNRKQTTGPEKPRIDNNILKSMMNRAAHGDVDALLGLSALLAHRTGEYHSAESIEEARQALAWAQHQAWQKKHLKKIFSDEVKRLMNDALHGDETALERLQLLKKEDRSLVGDEASVVLRFVEAKLAEQG